jgi:anaerobic selenocysteine-containing dehydrogenase
MRCVNPLNTVDAARCGPVDAQEVEIGNERGAIRAWLRITSDICPGVVALAGKWWGDSEGGAVANVLTASAWSPGGQPAYNDTFVRVIAGKPTASDDVSQRSSTPGI